jgi:hypothetical protein
LDRRDENMRFNHPHKSLRKNTRVVGHPAVRVCRLIRDRRAISAVISNIILIVAVIAIGFAVLAYVNSTSNSYVTQYGQTVNSDIDKLRETVAFEYAFYNNTATPKTLSVYFMNAGKVNNVTATTIYVSNYTFNSTMFQMKNLYDGPTNALNVGEEGYVVLSPITLVSGNLYTVKIITWRGSAFEYSFVA